VPSAVCRGDLGQSFAGGAAHRKVQAGRERLRSGTDILKIFSPKNLAKILAFFAQTAATLFKNLIITLVFEKSAHFFAENWKKTHKIVIITSTPGQLLGVRGEFFKLA
jgi:hypothetical protein